MTTASEPSSTPGRIIPLAQVRRAFLEDAASARLATLTGVDENAVSIRHLDDTTDTVTAEDIARVDHAMHTLVAADHPIERIKVKKDEAIRIFTEANMTDKLAVLRMDGDLYEAAQLDERVILDRLLTPDEMVDLVGRDDQAGRRRGGRAPIHGDAVRVDVEAAGRAVVVAEMVNVVALDP